MLLRLLCALLLLLLKLVVSPAAAGRTDFQFNSFNNANLMLNGAAEIEPSGILRLTNSSSQQIGRAFYPAPLPFLNTSGGAFSFSTSFVFAIVPYLEDISSEGLAFAISPTFKFSDDIPSQFLGLFNITDNGLAASRIVAVEIDTVRNIELQETNDGHVGINVNSMRSIAAAPASFATGPSSFQNMSMIQGEPVRVWADYDSKSMQFSVTIAPVGVPKPVLPLLLQTVNLTSVFSDQMYVGFSASTGRAAGSHYILGWSFSLNGRETELVLSDLASLSQPEKAPKQSTGMLIWTSAGAGIFLLITLLAIVLVLKRKRKSIEAAEKWDTGYGLQRFSYRDLHKATRSFSHENLLGSGGFGEVYKGVLPKSNQVVAVKRISRASRQGLKEFVAEITSIGRLRHRNLVQLLGYARREETLIIIYDYMPKGSLDKHLFSREEKALTWKQRFNIIKGVASGLLYLHEEWEQVVLHRDIKPSNVLIDEDFNGKLGDFGLARLHKRGGMAQTTHIVGTLGYIAPELSRTGKSTTSSDVFSFGMFILEVACGKRPVQLRTSGVEMVLVDWICEFLIRGELLEARDRRLGDDCSAEEVELVLKLGLMCSSPAPEARPSMRQVSQYLEGEAALPATTAKDFCTLAVESILFPGSGTSSVV